MEYIMNVRQLNKYEMLCSVYNFYDTEKVDLSSFSAVTAPFTDVKMICKEIELNEKIVNQGTKGKVGSKNTAQEEIIKNGLIIAGAIYAYAVEKNDIELMNFSDLSTRSFARLRDSEIPIKIDDILSKAEELGDLLTQFGATAAKRTAAKLVLDNYTDKFAELNSGKVSKKTANETINLLFDKADKKLKVLDKLMLGVQESNAELYTKYDNARVIIDKAASRKTAVADSPAQTTTTTTTAAK
jgi:hypothetical protein